jgi:hypothetical protein
MCQKNESALHGDSNEGPFFGGIADLVISDNCN